MLIFGHLKCDILLSVGFIATFFFFQMHEKYSDYPNFVICTYLRFA